jgi:Fe-Mn family superoxide dismutase
MTLHHDKHHAAYVEKLNAALQPYAELRRRSVRWLLQNSEAVPEPIRTAVHGNAGGHLNHSLFWQSMSPVGGSGPAGSIAAAIDETFGSLQQFKDQFDETGAKLFGSGWVWLVAARGNGTGKPTLEIVVTSGITIRSSGGNNRCSSTTSGSMPTTFTTRTGGPTT